MALPNFQQLMLPTLRHICQVNDEVQISALEDEIARKLELTKEDLSRVLPSGQQSVFCNRLNWPRAYMTRAGLLEAPRRGYCRATPRAHDLIVEAPKEIDLGILSRYPEFVAWRSKQKVEDPAPNADGKSNPEEQIAVNFDLLNRELASEIIGRVHSFSPSFFERLIVDLLVRMGYGGGRSEMGRALGRIGDGGIDGVIKEDELGLDVVYVQAKRFEPERAVPLREVRDFVGALEGHRASKGVFVTTSYFPDSAHDFIARVSSRVVLIDGVELAHLMIRHRIGIRVRDTYEIKRIDEDYFVE